MIRLGTHKEVEEYFSRSEVSQSFLKALRKGVAFTSRDEKSMYYEEKGHLVIGSGVDDKISMGNEAFAERYYSSAVPKPSDAIMSIVQMAFDQSCIDEEAPENDINSYPRNVLDAVNHHKYYPNWKEATRVNKILEGGYNYFEELKEAHGKQILTPVELEIIEGIERSWRTNFYTAKYFNHQGPDTHIFYQVPIYFEFMNVDCKCLLDIVIVNTKDKTIQIVDMKTMAENTIMFPKSASRFGYNFQAAFYTEGMNQLVILPETSDSIPELKALLDPDFQVLPFKFMVETTETKTDKLTDEVQYYQGNPLMYTMSEEQIHLGKYGRPELTVIGGATQPESKSYSIKHREILGFVQCIDLAIWHTFHGWEQDKKVVEANGDILI
jgi:hypothetical protein